jgi:BMFP domain-containing protein YqiC
MQVDNRLLDDLARLASGAVGSLAGLKEELDTLIRQRLERLLADMELVRREEFDAVKALAANARAGQEALEVRVAELEEALAKTRSPRAKRPTDHKV